jgi:hypothetical protein
LLKKGSYILLGNGTFPFAGEILRV